MSWRCLTRSGSLFCEGCQERPYPEGVKLTSPGSAKRHPGHEDGTTEMPQSLAKIYLHIVFSTWRREPFLADQRLRSEMHAYLGSVHEEYNSPTIAVGGTDDHVHVLCTLSRTHTVAKVVMETKRKSSKWVKQREDMLSMFHWQNGYGAFSVSHSNVPRVRKYIAHQEQHHRGMSFQDEYLGFLRKHGIEYDERYVWD